MTAPNQAGPVAESGRDRILVVDDDPDIARFLKLTLELQGFEVATAGNGQEALRLVSSWQPALVLVDLMMPEIDGIEVTRRLRANAMTTALPVIMLTAKAQTADKVFGLGAGADDYIVKPFDTMELVARVRGTLRRNQEFREVSPADRAARQQPDPARDQTTGSRPGNDYAVCYCDIDRFKAVNDAVRLRPGRRVHRHALARSRCPAVATIGPPPAFLGHVGGDDFVVVCTPGLILPLAERAVTEFEAAADALYDERTGSAVPRA